jgi:adenylate kinase family enzyme
MQRRLELYDRETAPLVDYYRSTRGNVVGIHADRSIEDVFTEIQQSLSAVEARA